MRKTQAIGALALLVPFAAIAADTPEIKAGRWEEVIAITGMTVGGTAISTDSIPGGASTRFVCMSAEDAVDPSKHFLGAGQDSKCTPNGMVTGGRINLIGQCTTEKFGQMIMTGEGSYNLSTFEVTAKMSGKLKERPISITMSSRGRHVGDCDGTES